MESTRKTKQNKLRCKNPKSQQKSTLATKLCALRSTTLRAAQEPEENRTTPTPAAHCAIHPRALRRNQKKTQKTEKPRRVAPVPEPSEKCSFNASA
ncbi:hypothetical protein A2U01_0062459 [Trifolium medium]|uniref:Uncharacterized protein n=1 Tax=Trifolium medium TaxID=97028 RepID=A0A392S071_9FABA|nr:hypothetical protein [Trifolium medium]